MEEKRRFTRWQVEGSKKARVSYAGVTEDVELLDISAGGMRVNFLRQIDIGSSVFGEVVILPNVGPYFVRGVVNRLDERSVGWDATIVFDKVSTSPVNA